MLKKAILKLKVAITKHDMKNTKNDDTLSCSHSISEKIFNFAKDELVSETKAIFNSDNEKHLQEFMKDKYLVDAHRDGSITVSVRVDFIKTEKGVKFTRKCYSIKKGLI